MGQTMNEALAANNVRDFRGLESITHDPSTRPPTFLERRLWELGVYDMAQTSTNKPSGFYVNWTTVTGLILVISTIAGLWYFTWQTANEAGYQRGVAEAQRQQSQKELDKMKGEMRLLEEKLKQVGGQ